MEIKNQQEVNAIRKVGKIAKICGITILTLSVIASAFLLIHVLLLVRHGSKIWVIFIGLSAIPLYFFIPSVSIIAALGMIRIKWYRKTKLGASLTFLAFLVFLVVCLFLAHLMWSIFYVLIISGLEITLIMLGLALASIYDIAKRKHIQNMWYALIPFIVMFAAAFITWCMALVLALGYVLISIAILIGGIFAYLSGRLTNNLAKTIKGNGVL